MKTLKVLRDVFTSYLVEMVCPEMRSNYHIQRHIPICLGRIIPDHKLILKTKILSQHCSLRLIRHQLEWFVSNRIHRTSMCWIWSFNAAQSSHSHFMDKFIEKMVSTVQTLFEYYPKKKKTDLFLMLQSVFESAQSVNRAMDFKSQHGKKKGLTDSHKIHLNLVCKKIFTTDHQIVIKNTNNIV